MLYEKIHCSEPFSQMHGAAVASIAVGKNVGVAPGAKLYYIASTYGHNLSSGGEFDASIIADCIYRVIEINKLLPAESKIRVISISRGYNKNDLGYEEIRQAIEDADREGIFVVTTTTYDYYGFILYGAERNYYDDPDLPEVYHLQAWDSSKS